MEYHKQNDHFVMSFFFTLQCCVKSRLHSGSGSSLLLRCSVCFVYTVDMCVHVCSVKLSCRLQSASERPSPH